jgi:hypothetical protein
VEEGAALELPLPLLPHPVRNPKVRQMKAKISAEIL